MKAMAKANKFTISYLVSSVSSVLLYFQIRNDSKVKVKRSGKNGLHIVVWISVSLKHVSAVLMFADIVKNELCKTTFQGKFTHVTFKHKKGATKLEVVCFLCINSLVASAWKLKL